jgi:hypothetical protein
MEKNARIREALQQAAAQPAEAIVMAYALSLAVNGDPQTYEEAMASPQKVLWQQAIKEESTSILRNETFAINKQTESIMKPPIGSKWVFKTKRNPDGSLRYKARLVIKGYMQNDWGETYAPVGKLTSFRYLASSAAALDLRIDHMDVVTAFLNPEVDDANLYMIIPEGWDSECSNGEIKPGTIVKLNKALYGLKQAPRLWYRDIDTFLRFIGFIQSHADPNLYIYGNGTRRVLLLLYVDDLSIGYPASAASEAVKIKASLKAKYRITDLGTAKQFLGIQVEIGPRSNEIMLSQSVFICSVLRRYGMENSSGVATPMDTHTKLDAATGHDDKEADPKLYQAIIGSLMYLALATRPDIAFAVSALSRYNAHPLTTHLTAAIRVLRYLKATVNHKLHFVGDTNEIIGYTDSDWANDRADRKSQGGYVFLCNNGAISWQSRKQDLVAMSTTEAEYIACSEASREARWLRQLQKDTQVNEASENNPMHIYTDSQGALKHITTAGGITKARTKHIDVCYHNSRDLHAREIVKYDYVNTNDNPADLLTKALPREKHEKFTRAMGIY